MIPVLQNPRYERKFVTDTIALPEVLSIVRRHPALFRETYLPRRVNNLYLDTHDLRDYQDHVNGIGHRRKTRVRWYGTPNGVIRTPSLEQKLRQGLAGGKVSHRLPPVPVNGHVSRSGLEAAFDEANLPGITRLALRQLHPSLANSYWRHYFESADRRFRLTVDSGLEFAEVHAAFEGHLPARIASRIVVVELKFCLDAAEGADYITSAFPLRLARCSKYVLGIGSLAAR